MYALFGALSVVCAALVVYNRSKEHIPSTTNEFKKFQLTYLVPYFIMSASDWLQGPYVYALYESYGYSIGEIGFLFTIGFGSSMIFGTFVGSISDKYGRKSSCILYALLYIISCATKHSHSFYILLIGRLTGGIGTSILFSAFESWMVSEHFSRKFPEEWLGYTFYLQVFGNGIVAIVSGLIASFVKDFFKTMTSPFDTAIVLLIIGGLLIAFYWNENYGNTQVDWKQNFITGFNTITTDYKVACLGISQSMFEAAMYIFVFMWTPTLDIFMKNYSHGLVFACFMVSVMIGSSLFKMLSSYTRIEKLLVFVFIVSIASLMTPIFARDGTIIISAFLVFEACVGMFWPSISTLKGKYVPEAVRSTVMNYFRMPTNLFVLVTLNRVNNIPHHMVFTITVILISIAVFSQIYVSHATATPMPSKLGLPESVGDDEEK